jgi:hypothetical protein
VEIKTYNKKGFLLPDSILSAAMFHAKILPTGEYMFRIHDCNDGIRLRGDITDPEQVVEAIEKLRVLAAAALEFASFIEGAYLTTPEPPRHAMIDVITEMAGACGFSYAQIVSGDKPKDLHAVRQLIYMRLATLKYPYTHIGKAFNRSHSAIIGAVQKGYKLLEVHDSHQAGFIKMIENHEREQK